MLRIGLAALARVITAAWRAYPHFAINGLAALAGVITSVLVTMVLQSIAHVVAPPSQAIIDAMKMLEGGSIDDVEKAREIFRVELAQQPLALVIVIATHAVGTFLGALTAVRISRLAQVVPVSIVGGLMLLGGIANVMMIPHPPWFNVIDLLLYVPAALLAWKLTGSKNDSPTGTLAADESDSVRDTGMSPVDS